MCGEREDSGKAVPSEGVLVSHCGVRAGNLPRAIFFGPQIGNQLWVYILSIIT